ncbi:MAG: hypothetical protein PHI63_04740 [Patescibacteria group bacterium]|nr:hypothetical protein [Patescibacteria group bacterium]
MKNPVQTPAVTPQQRRAIARWVAAFLFALTIPLAIVPPAARAQDAFGGGDSFAGDSGSDAFAGDNGVDAFGGGDSFSSVENPTAVQAEDQKNWFQKAWEWLKTQIKEFLKTTAAVAYKRALTYFLQTLAVDYATYLASGGQGQKPLFETEGWGTYLSRVGDSAAGAFIETLAEGLGLPNLCQPRFNLKLKLTLGLMAWARPQPPVCTFTQMADNWDNFIQTNIDNPEKLNQMIDASFSPYDNDLGIGLGVWSSFYSTVEGAKYEGGLSRLEKQGFKDITGINGSILTPGVLIRENVISSQDPQTLGQVYFTYTGQAVADAVDAFTTTLVAKSAQRLFEKGFNRNSTPAAYNWTKLEGLRSYAADASAGNPDIRQEFTAFYATTPQIGDPRANRIDVTAQLVGEGVITQSFKTAIDRKLTVRQAIDQGLLYADGAGATYGYSRAGVQPNANEGYSYNAMVILRKYRILPVGWELAAAYIGKLEQKKTYSLGDIIRGFADRNSPFYGLVDDGWVLKAPESYCRITGTSDKLLTATTRKETIVDSTKPVDPVTRMPVAYEFQRRVVTRDSMCVDVRSCIVEDENGNCRAYGLCTEERPIWRFPGRQCPAQYNSCRAYEGADGSSANYLDNTLQSGSCGAESVDCTWYCGDFNVGSGAWACVNESERVRKPCQQSGRCSVSNTICVKDAECPRSERCQNNTCLATDVATGVSCAIPYGAISCTVPSCGVGENFVPNSGFETESTTAAVSGGRVAFAANWSTANVAGGASLWQRATGVGNRAAAGSFAARVDADGTVSRMIADSQPLSPPAAVNPPYTLTAKVYSTLTFGRAYVSVVPTAGSGCSTAGMEIAKGQWATVSCVTSDNLAGATVQLAVDAVSGINPVGSVWFDEIRIERACPQKDVTVYLEGTQEHDGSKMYFDRDVAACTAEENGCRALVPLVKNGNVNLIYNGSFEDWPGASNRFPPGWVVGAAGSVTAVSRPEETAALGGYFLRYTDDNATVEDFGTYPIGLLLPGRTYQITLSAKAAADNTDWRVWLDGTDRTGTVKRQSLVAVGLGKCAGGLHPDCRRDEDCAPPAQAADLRPCESDLPLKTNWQRITFEPVEAQPALTDLQLTFGSTAANSTIDLDGVTMAEVPARSTPVTLAYRDYRGNPVTYFKTPPPYLGCTGDPETDHQACSRYAGVCRADEVGCERYTPSNGAPPLPAIIDASDYCPASCVGYSAYAQSPTFFADAIPSSQEPDFLYFIARTARQCEAKSVGCEEFTNLDELSRGGEGKVSYNYLRQCTKPDVAVCKEYYTWVGSETSGYQLKTYTLRDYNNDFAPDVVPIPNETALGLCQYNGKPVPAGGPGPAAVGTCTYDSTGAALPAGTETWDGTGCVNITDAKKNAQKNPNCREFFATNGQVYYRLLRQTVACSADCHPFRLIDTSQAACEGSGGAWGVCGTDGNANGRIDSGEELANCISQGGMQLVGGADCFMRESVCTTIAGAMFQPRNECIYQAVPAESQSCPAAQSGCREYRGNASANVRTVFSDDFEDGDTAGWAGGTISSDAVTVGGHSMAGGVISTQMITVPGGGACNTLVAKCATAGEVNCHNVATDTCLLESDGQHCTAHGADTRCGVMADMLTPNRSFQLKFWAKVASGVSTMNVTLAGVDCGRGASCELLNGNRVTTEWQEYVTQPILVSSVTSAAQLQLTATGGGVAYDFITLTQVQEYDYLIKNSWKTPVECNTNPALDPAKFPAPNAPLYMLGCQEYVNSAGQALDLKSFRRLCRDSSVGCQEFIDTQNTLSAILQRYNTGHPQAEVVVPQDRLAYYVVDVGKTCNSIVKGCQAFGKPTVNVGGEVTTYQTKYLVNDPERYGSTLCLESEVGCKEYASPQAGTVYFREPAGRTCEYRLIPSQTTFGWFIIGSGSVVPDCPVTTYRLGITQPARTCQGGDLNGKVCSSDADCSFKVCRGGAAEGARCAASSDCQVCVGGDRAGQPCRIPGDCPNGGVCNLEGACEQSAGACVPWVGLCPAEYASCTAYVDPTSDPQAGILPNSNFEGFFRACNHDEQTVCRLDSDCVTAVGNQKFCADNMAIGCDAATPCPGGSACVTPTCSFTKLNSWGIADPTIAGHFRGGGLNGSSALRITAATPKGNEVRQAMSMSANMLYTVSAYVKDTAADAAIVITTLEGTKRPIFSQFDNSVAITKTGTLSTNGDTVVLPVGGVSGGPFQRFSGRFYVTTQERGIVLMIQNAGTFDNVEVKPTGVYHYLSESLDRTSCNGIVDPPQGCVLVNDTSDPTLRYSTAATAKGQPPQVCLPKQCVGGDRPGTACESGTECGDDGVCRPGTCDSNMLVSVTPDRTCARWLECISTRKQTSFVSGTQRSYCQQIATCDQFDSISGRCNSYPTEELMPQTFDAGTVELTQHLSGYSKVGFRWDQDLQVPGYYPYGVMTQRKLCVAGAVGSVCLDDADCNTNNKLNGVCQPVLQVGSDAKNDVIYESCRVYPASDSPRWGAYGPADTGAKPAKSVVTDVSEPFSAPEFGGSKALELLDQASECHYRKSGAEFIGAYGFCVEQDPRSPYLCLNWLPVDELTGGWIGIAGWNGNLRNDVSYCTEGALLETRYPGQYAVGDCDKSFDILKLAALGLGISGVLGVGAMLFGVGSLGAVAGFVGGAGLVTLIGIGGASDAVNNMWYFTSGTDDTCGTVVCPVGYLPEVWGEDCSTVLQTGYRCHWACKPDESDLFETELSSGRKWYDYHDRVTNEGVTTKKQIMYCPKCGAGKVMWDPETSIDAAGMVSWRRVCTEVVKVTSPEGTDRGWKKRLEATPAYASTGYHIQFLDPYGYAVETLNRPFGSISSAFRGDPVKWKMIQDNIDPRSASSPKFPAFVDGLLGQASNVGQLYFDRYYREDSPGVPPSDALPVPTWGAGIERIKRIYAQSYGRYRWDGARYVSAGGISVNYCVGGPRNGQDCDAPGNNAKCVDGYNPADPGNPTPSTCQQAGGYCLFYPPAGSSDPSTQAATFTSCDRDADCGVAPNVPVCAYGTCWTDDGNDLNNSGKPCRVLGDCTGGETCSKTVPIWGACNGPAGYTRQGVACQSDDGCKVNGVGNCQNLNQNGKCYSGIFAGMACGGAGGMASCFPVGSMAASCVGRCSATSAYKDRPCISDTNCRNDGVCQAVGNWVPPGTPCLNNIRDQRFSENPATDPDGVGDWCGVYPEVFNVKIENAETPIYMQVGQANVTLSFNLKVDPDQTPLQMVRVLWDMTGKDKGDASFAWKSGMNDKPNPNDPFQFTHTYQYAVTCDTGLTDGDAATPASNFCEFQVGIQGRDNWCWCTNEKYVGVKPDNTCNDCPNDPTPRDATDDNGAWVEEGNARVRVCSPGAPELCGL